jgi:PilZ domain-containing protein
MYIIEDARVRDILPNRRSHSRHETCWFGHLMIGAEQRECYVYNVSLGGAKLLVFGAFEAQERAVLSVAQFGDFQCALRWVDGQFVGVKFAAHDHDRAGDLVAQALTRLPLGELPSVAEFVGL